MPNRFDFLYYVLFVYLLMIFARHAIGQLFLPPLFSFGPHTLPRFSKKKNHMNNESRKSSYIKNVLSLSLSLVGDDSFSFSSNISRLVYEPHLSRHTHTGIYVWSIFNDEEIPQRWYHPLSLSRLSAGPSKGGRPRVWYLIIKNVGNQIENKRKKI